MCYLDKTHIRFIDWTKVFFEIQHFKSAKGFHNLQVDVQVLKEIIENNAWYKIYIPQDKLEFNSFANVAVWQELVVVLLKKYIEQFYLYHKNKFNANHIETRILQADDENLIQQYDVRLNRNEEIDAIQFRFEHLKTSVTYDGFNIVEIASGIEAFDTLIHLYKPLIYLGKGYENKVQVYPVALNETEARFMHDFEREIERLQQAYKLDEVFLLRNQSKKGIGFFAEGNNFYPDFMLWMKKEGKQYLTFIDPKGIRNSKGITDAKIQFHKYLTEKVQPQVISENLILNSFIISNTKLLEINWHGDLTIPDFNKHNVLFQEEQNKEYIGEIVSRILHS